MNAPRTRFAIGVAGVTLFVLAGCGSFETRSAGQLPPQKSAKETRLREAIRGLDFSSGRVNVLGDGLVDSSRAVKLTRKAEQAFRVENNWSKAAGLYRDAILQDREHAPAYEGLAMAIQMEGEPGMPEAALRTALDLDPRYGKARFELGALAQKRGDYAEAIQIWKELVSREPNYPDAFARLSIASYFNGDSKGAWTYLAEADKCRQNVPPQFRSILKEARKGP